MIITILEIFTCIYLSGNIYFTFRLLKDYSEDIKEIQPQKLFYFFFICLGIGSIIYIVLKLSE